MDIKTQVKHIEYKKPYSLLQMPNKRVKSMYCFRIHKYIPSCWSSCSTTLQGGKHHNLNAFCETGSLHQEFDVAGRVSTLRMVVNSVEPKLNQNPHMRSQSRGPWKPRGWSIQRPRRAQPWNGCRHWTSNSTGTFLQVCLHFVTFL